MQESNAGHSGVFLTPKGHSLASGGNVATVWAKSTFERPLSCVSESDAGDLDLLPAYSHCLVVRRGKAVFDQVSYHIDVEPVGEQSCPGAAAQPCVGKQFERPPLFCAKVNPRQTNAPQRQNFLADRICHLTVYANRGCRRPRAIRRRSAEPRELWRSTVTYMNSVKIVSASL
jgi:hypothetical protein